MKLLRTIPGLITVISLFFSVIWLSPASAVAAPSFASLGQVKAERLQAPVAMDLDAAGNLYVADARGGEVFKFNPYGGLMQVFDVQGTGRGLAVSADGSTLYVAREQSVAVVDVASGQELGLLDGAEELLPEFEQAGEVDLDAAGNVYVADKGRLQVKIYGADGQYRSRFGGAGTTAGLFMRIEALTVNDIGQVVVVDASAENGRVQVFSLDAGLNVVSVASYLKAATNFGPAGMMVPCSVTFDEQGRGYFLEFISSQVRVVDAGFAYLGSYANPGRDQGQLNHVMDAVFDKANKRLFVGCDAARIEILGVDGGQNPVNVNHAPSAPVIQEPLAGSEVATLQPTLVFAEATDPDGNALSYKVTVSDGVDEVFAADVATTSVVVGVLLAENASYSWSVQASDGVAVSGVSVSSFVVNAEEEPPVPPVATSPLQGEAFDGEGVLEWLETSDPDPNDTVVGYQVEIALDETFVEPVVVESTETVGLALRDVSVYGDLVDGTTYFWRVVALDNEGVASLPSETGRFLYDTTALTVTANIPGAVVSLSGNHAYAGQVIGVAPLELRDFVPGNYSVVVERAGFEPFVAQVNLAENDNAAVYAEMVPAMAVGNLSESKNGINGRSGLTVGARAVPFLVDFDNDGDLDLLTAEENGQLTLFANLQLAGSNRLYLDNGAPLAPTGIVPFVADWDNDGRKDLIVGQADGGVTLYANVGTEAVPVFSAGTELLSISVGLDAAPAVVDYNGDGAKDLLVGNAAGQVLLFMNQGDDATPVFAANDLGQQVLKLSGRVVPFPVDWDADGRKELLVAHNGAIVVYAMVDGQYQPVAEFSNKAADFFAAFPIALDGGGKQLLAGKVDGALVYVTGNSAAPVASFVPALQAKVAELGELVAAENPELLPQVSAISGMIDGQDFAGAALAADALAALLNTDAARTSALELAALCRW